MAGENEQNNQENLSDGEISKRVMESWKLRQAGDPDELDFALASVSFTKLYRELPNGVIDYLRQNLTGIPLIDLGSGTMSMATAKSFIKKFGISEYIGVDIDAMSSKTQIEGIPVSTIESEALAFLSGFRGKANVMSNGFLCSELVGRGEYLNKILHQIKRILSPNGVLIATHFDLDQATQSEGFIQEKVVGVNNQYKKFVSFKV